MVVNCYIWRLLSLTFLVSLGAAQRVDINYKATRYIQLTCTL